MEVMEAIKTRYSARQYANKTVEPEKLGKILEAGCLAPTADNQQRQRHIAVTDSELIRAMVPACEGQGWVKTAAAIIFECSIGDRLMPCGQSARSMDGAIAVSFMMLEAVSLGLQTCWLGGFSVEKVKALLNIPDDYTVIAGLALGYPETQGRPAPKKGVNECVSYNRM